MLTSPRSVPDRVVYRLHGLSTVQCLGDGRPDSSLLRMAAARLAVGSRRLAAHQSRGPSRSRLDQGTTFR